MYARRLTGLLGMALVLGLGCESSGGKGDGSSSGGGGGGGDDAILSACTYSFKVVNAGGKGFAQSCSGDAECEFGVCMKPGNPGNGTGEFGNASNEPINTQFGYCTRGCNCDNDTTSRLTDAEKTQFECYNGPVGSQGKVRHVLARCTNVGGCGTFDSGWTECGLPNGSGVNKVCLAP